MAACPDEAAGVCFNARGGLTEGGHIIRHAPRGILLNFGDIYVSVIVPAQRVRRINAAFFRVRMRAGMLSGVWSPR